MRLRTMTVGGLIAAGIMGVAGVVYASTITYIDPGGAYVTACVGGAAGVTFGPDNDVQVECAFSDPETVICGLPGVVDALPGPDGQALVTCDEPK